MAKKQKTIKISLIKFNWSNYPKKSWLACGAHYLERISWYCAVNLEWRKPQNKIHQIAWKELTSKTTEKSLKFNFFHWLWSQVNTHRMKRLMLTDFFSTNFTFKLNAYCSYFFIVCNWYTEPFEYRFNALCFEIRSD